MNDVFGRLTVVGDCKTINKRRYAECICDCGQTKMVRQDHLRSGKVVSCGCYNEEIKRLRITHGKAGTRIYRMWKNIKSRCTNPNVSNYADYGGRGIKICDAWHGCFEQFHDWAMQNGYSDELSIDRVDNDGDYTPENCKFSNRQEQALNRRSNVMVNVTGSLVPAKVAACFLGIKYKKALLMGSRKDQSYA